jgi:Phage integrase family
LTVGLGLLRPRDPRDTGPVGAHHFAHAQTGYPQHASLSGKRVGPHTFRHSVGVQLVAAGVDVTVIRDWLGHARGDTTNLYARANIDTKRKALDQVDPATILYNTGARRRVEPDCLRVHIQRFLDERNQRLTRRTGLSRHPREVGAVGPANATAPAREFGWPADPVARQWCSPSSGGANVAWVFCRRAV